MKKCRLRFTIFLKKYLYYALWSKKQKGIFFTISSYRKIKIHIKYKKGLNRALKKAIINDERKAMPRCR